MWVGENERGWDKEKKGEGEREIGGSNNFEVWGKPQVCQKDELVCPECSWKDFSKKCHI